MNALSNISQLARVATVVLCVLSVMPSSASSQDLPELIVAVDAARSSHRELLAAFEQRRTQFDALLNEIDELKDEREDASTMTGDTALRDARWSARQMADRLEDEQGRLAELVDDVTQLEAQLIRQIDQQRRDLEGGLSAADAEGRAQALQELRDLTELRRQYETPLPQVPTVELGAILFGLEDDVTPEELLATADELFDNAQELEDYITELESRIGELEHRDELDERARRANAQSSLFEEGVNSGQRATPRPSSVSGSGEASETETTATNEGSEDQQSRSSQDAAEPGGESNNTVTLSDDDAQATSPGTDEPTGTGGSFAEGEEPDSDGDGLANEVAPPTAPNDPSDATRTGTVDTPTPAVIDSTVSGTVRPTVDSTILWTGTGTAEPEASVRGGRNLNELRSDRDSSRTRLQELQRQRLLILERVEELERDDL